MSLKIRKVRIWLYVRAWSWDNYEASTLQYGHACQPAKRRENTFFFFEKGNIIILYYMDWGLPARYRRIKIYQPTLFQASRHPNSITILKCGKSRTARYSCVCIMFIYTTVISGPFVYLYTVCASHYNIIYEPISFYIK